MTDEGPFIGERVAIVELHIADRRWNSLGRDGAITGRLDAIGERGGRPCYWVEVRFSPKVSAVLMATEIVSIEPLVIEGVSA